MTYRTHAYQPFDAAAIARDWFQSALASLPPADFQRLQRNRTDWEFFRQQVDTYLPQLLTVYFEIYESCVDATPVFQDLLQLLIRSWIRRDDSLRQLDRQRSETPDWFQSSKLLGGVCYVDLYAGNFAGLEKRIPFFQEMGINYMHLMPVFAVPEGESDGGYAISDYRQTDARLGNIDDLRGLIEAFHSAGISVALDFVFNHTASDHAWARAAMEGDPVCQGYYWMFPDRTMPDEFEKTLREIFPSEHPGAFTWVPEIGQWVWTTFHSYQWDLNYQNPAVFKAMAGEMLFLANLGVDVLRLDAVAFIWKTLGTTCESQPNAFKLVEAFNLIARISAPSMLFKSEAIVHPDQVNQYIAVDRCQLSYNPLLMALLWESLATRQVKLLSHSLEKRFALPEGTSWVNYLRCHDDIGWTFSDEDAAEVGIHSWDHRQFLNQFYTGRFQGSFAKGLPFQENLKTGDCRISGMLASLAGLERAEELNDPEEIALSVAKIHMLFGIIMTIGGIPLIYLGDELGMTNCYDFLDDPLKKDDTRWVHRCASDPGLEANRKDPDTITGQIYAGICALIRVRQSHPLFGLNNFRVLHMDNEHIFGYEKHGGGECARCFANFSEHPQLMTLPAGITPETKTFSTLPENELVFVNQQMQLDPYQFICLFEKG